MLDSSLIEAKTTGKFISIQAEVELRLTQAEAVRMQFGCLAYSRSYKENINIGFVT